MDRCRSGHSLHVSGSTLLVLGGRDDHVLETHPVPANSDQPPAPRCDAMVRLGRAIADGRGGTAAARGPMSGRKQHAACGGGGVVFVHGGWTFDGRTRDPVGEMYALVPRTGKWAYLGESGVRRAGHVCCCDDRRGVVLHGGEGARSAIHGSLHHLVVSL